MNSISGTGSVQGMMGLMGMGKAGGPRGGTDLTDAQKTQIQKILADYDPENITEATAREIFQKFSDAGIEPGRGMKEAIEGAGFDAEGLRELGMPSEFQKASGGHRGEMRQMPAITDEQKTTVSDILSEYDPENLAEADVRSILQAFREAGIGPADGLKEVIEEAGFDADLILKIPHSDGREEHFWASQSVSESIDLTSLQSLQSILDQYDFSNISTDQETSLRQQLQASGFFQGSSINLGI